MPLTYVGNKLKTKKNCKFKHEKICLNILLQFCFKHNLDNFSKGRINNKIDLKFDIKDVLHVYFQSKL